MGVLYNPRFLCNFARQLHTASTTPASSRSGNFHLCKLFLQNYENVAPPFGFNSLGEIVYRRTYSRLKSNGEGEQWWETVERVVNGTYNMQKRWLDSQDLAWDPSRAQSSAQAMYERIFNMKFLPPGRGLWAMGSSLTEERGIFSALNNCAFVSTETMWDKGSSGREPSPPSRPFTFLMDAAMLGVGVGFDTKGASVAAANAYILTGPSGSNPVVTYTIPDSREGWVKSVGLLIDSYLEKNMGVQVSIFTGVSPHLLPCRNQSHRSYFFHNKLLTHVLRNSPQLSATLQKFNYGLIRPKGERIKGFGGLSSGPQALLNLHQKIRETLERNVGRPLTVTSIVDLMNLIGKCVISGNVRRTAEIAFGDPTDEEYVDLKNYEVNPQRREYGWTSNNSVFATLGMDYSKIVERVTKNGEPGFAWLENAQQYSRMIDQPLHLFSATCRFQDNKDHRAKGGNPCLEQTLEPYELCCLVETFPLNHTTLNDYLETLEYAFLYAKTVTLGTTHWHESNAVMLRNRRIGCSISGIAQFVSQRGLHTLKEWCESGYQHIQKIDRDLSEWLCIPRSIKTTTIKPSGTVSLLAGATPGMHYPESRYCIRRVRLSEHSDLIEPLRAAGYKIERDVVGSGTYVVEIPIDHGEGVRGLEQVSVWEQLSLAAFLQKYWSDNQVSCTVTFDPKTEGSQVEHALNYFQYQLKGISFLPRLPHGAYAQMPFEAITEEQYNSMISSITHHASLPAAPLKIDLSRIKSRDKSDPDSERYCDSASCVVGPVSRI
ncbi:hypothetical protein BC937DRAFT_92916 [Endogone sp. FLAS-F59071]|nr:hypothetical protein BC937DRAFT_92916 [Endogone sp. FLAS-F59071]|eukprot:RUS15087.1 hypothetical protein BC937DRAFT_92916 [Endogone sp. FLAS-F59071]